MRGSSALRTSVAPGGALAGPWAQNSLWTAARAVPSLDLRFADNKSLTDSATGASLVTHTRASSGTFVGSDGVLRSAVTNLLVQSENLGTTWTTTGLLAFGSGSTLNATTAPDGTTTADLVTENSSTSEHRVETAAISWVANTTYTLTIFAKANGRTRLDFFGVGGGNFTGGRNVSFNLSTGTVIATDGAVASIEARPDGWYRVRMTLTTSAAPSASSLFIRFLDNSNNFSYTGNGTSGIYLWGAQLEQSATVGEYIPTTSTINSAPRFDHNPTTGESLGLLVEEQRTNLRPQSESIIAANNYGVSSATSVASSIAAPTGATSGASIFVIDSGVSTGDTNLGTINLGSGISLTNGVVYTSSIFVKSAGGTVLRIRNNAAGGIYDYVLSGAGTAPSITSELQGATIQSFSNGWYRCSWTYTAKATAPGSRGDYWALKTNVNDGTSGIYLWGAQLEAGAFPTSYIPTVGTGVITPGYIAPAVTRAADVASITGSNFSSWYNQTEGTVFAECAVAQPASGGNQFVFRANDNSFNNNTTLNIQGSGFASIATAASGVFDGAAASVLALSANTAAKFAGAYATNNLGVSLNGATAVTDTSATMPTALNRLDIGSDHIGSNRVKAGTIKRLTYFPTRLSNEVLQRITQ